MTYSFNLSDAQEYTWLLPLNIMFCNDLLSQFPHLAGILCPLLSFSLTLFTLALGTPQCVRHIDMLRECCPQRRKGMSLQTHSFYPSLHPYSTPIPFCMLTTPIVTISLPASACSTLGFIVSRVRSCGICFPAWVLISYFLVPSMSSQMTGLPSA